jgi:hypothetical protein
MDPHKRSATIEVMTGDETIVGGERFATDRDGFAAMLRYVGQSPDRVWAIEGAPASASTSPCGCWQTARRSSTCHPSSRRRRVRAFTIRGRHPRF